jgi:glutamyl-tRNA reductase
MQGREDRPLIVIDLAVPRNVDPRVREVPYVEVYDMDDLQAFAKSTGNISMQELPRVQAIVEGEVADYEKLLRIIPFIGELHKKVEDIRQREVEKALRHLNNPSPEVSLQMELLSRSLVQKVLHEPTMHLRTETNQETLNDYVDTLARLFDLAEGTSETASKESL